MEWQTISLPSAIVERIEKDKDPWAPYSPMIGKHVPHRSLSSTIKAALGYPSTSAFVQEAIRRHLNSKEREYDAIQEEREVGRRVLGKRDPGDL